MNPNTSPLKLSIVVVGCGLGGLAAALCLGRAGHRVTVFEAASEATEIGVGIQVPPNVSRLLREWGLQEELEKTAVKPRAASWRRYDTGTMVGELDARKLEEKYGVPHYNVHRGELHRIMYNAAKVVANIITNSRVTAVNVGEPEMRQGSRRIQPTVILSDGRQVCADVVVGADGVKSVTRGTVCGDSSSGSKTNSAHRVIVPTSEMIKDSALKELVENTHVTCWMGPGRNIVGYCVSGGTGYNLVLSCPSTDDMEPESWSIPSSPDMIRNDYLGWEPRIQKLIDLIPSSSKWKLVDRPILSTWVHHGGVVLIGDACHPLLPYGAAMAMEDAAVLAALLTNPKTYTDIPHLLDAYADIRKPRCTYIQDVSRKNGAMFHLDDGPGQVARDLALSKLAEGGDNNERQFGYNVHEEVQQWIEKNPL
ncbi:hypothetical protein C8F04DRAFT_1322629 [Mycena alexandri]|uniref:FAD-binding domain-containing protein n=1 Tax=Mycena alexandri TaxID=1745969 RepID=A0AAD6TIR9_9AGAR|nr:hypothetical protein C8F04DRAFT_1322629 [Mycena alexandri]